MSSRSKRKRINWLYVLAKLDNDEINNHFFALLSKIRRGKTRFSSNRAAYCSLKHYYSTTTINELVKKVGCL